MKFTVKDTLTEEEIKSGLNSVIKDGLASQAMATFTGGIFLVALALKLGASNTVIGLLAAIPPLAQLWLLTIPLLIGIHILMGITMAGVVLASGNIGLKLAPKGQATVYLATHNLVVSLAAGIAPIVGGNFADFFAGRELSLTLKWSSPLRDLAFQTLSFQHWDFFFFFAFIIGLYSIHRLTMVKEVGEVEEKILISELITEVRREMKNFSTVGGLRQAAIVPFLTIKYLKKIKDAFTL